MGNGTEIGRVSRQGEYPFRVFISHKISEHRNAVERLKDELMMFAERDRLEIFISEHIDAGEKWSEEVHSALEDSDLLILIYLFSEPPADHGWCLYETGYFARKTRTGEEKKLICLTNTGHEAPAPLRCYQSIPANRDGIMELLRAVFADRHKPVRPSLFEGDSRKKLEETVEKILDILKPGAKKTPLSPRIWITMADEHFEDFKKGNIPLPMDCKISGETEAFRKLGVSHMDNTITLTEFNERVECSGPLGFFFGLFSEILKEIINDRPGPWRIPAVRVMKEGLGRIIVPAMVEKCPDGDYRFEFVITEPPPNFDVGKKSDFADLYHLFIIAWHFRWRVIDQHLESLTRICSSDTTDPRIQKEIRMELKKVKLDLDTVILDSLNRGYEYSADVYRHFTGEDKKLFQRIVEPQAGVWAKLIPVLLGAIEQGAPEGALSCLETLRDLNKTSLIIILNRLKEMAQEENMTGKLVSVEMIDNDILPSL